MTSPISLSTRRLFMRLMGRSRRKGISYNPYDRAKREQLAEQILRDHGNDEPIGTIRRSRLLLDIIEESFPTDSLKVAYFENLEILLKPKTRRPTAGQILLGLGSGRNGSTSLAALLRTIEGSCCTHENPPLISWTPEAEELQFHFRRLRLLSQYYSIVADVSHWWLTPLDEFFKQFPEGKAVALIRSTDACVNSFMRIKGSGRNSYNHWAPYGTGIWAAAQWDPTYPTYSLPPNAHQNPDGAKFQLVERYVREYNDRLRSLASKTPQKVMLVKTEELSAARVQKAIFEFVGMHGFTAETKLNASTVEHGRMPDLKF